MVLFFYHMGPGDQTWIGRKCLSPLSHMASPKIIISNAMVVWIGMAPHGLMCLKVWLIGSGLFRRCGLVGVGVALSEEVCHRGWALWFSNDQARHIASLFLLPTNLDVELSATSPSLHLSMCYHTTHHDDNGLSLCNSKPAPMTCFPF